MDVPQLLRYLAALFGLASAPAALSQARAAARRSPTSIPPHHVGGDAGRAVASARATTGQDAGSPRGDVAFV